MEISFHFNFYRAHEIEITNRKTWYFNIIFVLQLHFKYSIFIYFFPHIRNLLWCLNCTVSWWSALSSGVNDIKPGKHKRAATYSRHRATNIVANENHPTLSKSHSHPRLCHLGLIWYGLTQIRQNPWMVLAFVGTVILMPDIKELTLDYSLSFCQSSNVRIN